MPGKDARPSPPFVARPAEYRADDGSHDVGCEPQAGYETRRTVMRASRPEVDGRCMPQQGMRLDPVPAQPVGFIKPAGIHVCIRRTQP